MQNSHENIKNQNRENARATSILFMKYLTMSRSHILGNVIKRYLQEK
jgi:hypothetical protein